MKTFAMVLRVTPLTMSRLILLVFLVSMINGHHLSRVTSFHFASPRFSYFSFRFF